MPDTAMDPNALRTAAAEVAALMRALGNQDRLMLMCQLSQGEACVGELENACGVFQPSLSQHLGVLRREGLVDTRRDGKHIYYRIADDKALAILRSLYNTFCPQGVR